MHGFTEDECQLNLNPLSTIITKWFKHTQTILVCLTILWDWQFKG